MTQHIEVSDPYQSPAGDGREKHLALLRSAGVVNPRESAVTPKGVVVNLTEQEIGEPLQPALESETL